MTTTDYKLYHRLSSGAALTTKDNGDGVYPELFGSEESLEALRAVVEQELADGFVSRYPARGELVVMQQDSEGEQTELERWPVEELLGVAAVAGGGVGALRSWMGTHGPRLGCAERRGGISLKEGGAAFLVLWERVRIHAPEQAEQEQAWLIGAVKTSPSMFHALMWCVDWYLLDSLEAARGFGEQGEYGFWRAHERSGAAQVASTRARVERADHLAKQLAALGLERPPRLSWSEHELTAAQEVSALLGFLQGLPTLFDAQGNVQEGLAQWWRKNAQESLAQGFDAELAAALERPQQPYDVEQLLRVIHSV